MSCRVMLKTAAPGMLLRIMKLAETRAHQAGVAGQRSELNGEKPASKALMAAVAPATSGAMTMADTTMGAWTSLATVKLLDAPTAAMRMAHFQDGV